MARNISWGHVLLVISNSLSFQINAANRTFTSSYLQSLYRVLSGLRDASTTSHYAFYVCFFQLAIMPSSRFLFFTWYARVRVGSHIHAFSHLCVSLQGWVPQWRNSPPSTQELSLRANRAARDSAQFCRNIYIFWRRQSLLGYLNAKNLVPLSHNSTTQPIQMSYEN